MLGEYLEDPHGVEEGGSMRGMGLLPMRTVFTEEKTRTRVDGTFSSVHGILQALSGVAFSGYEIHMGQSIGKEGTDTLTEIHDTNRRRENLQFVSENLRVPWERMSMVPMSMAFLTAWMW